MHKFSDFKDYNSLTVFDGSKFSSYEEAKKSGASYTTGSSIDDLNIHGDTFSIGFDMSEVVCCIQECLGVDDIQAGIINKKGEFVEIPFEIGEEP